MNATAPKTEQKNILKLKMKETVLACVTCKTPTGGAGYDDVEAAYEAWKESAAGREGYTESFWMALYEPASTPQKIMFAHLFDAQPDGLQAAQAYKNERFGEFTALLKSKGFADIGEEQHFLYEGGSNIP